MVEKIILATCRLVAVLACLAFCFSLFLSYGASDIGQMQANYVCLPKNFSMVIYPNGFGGVAVDYVNQTFQPVISKPFNASFNLTFCMNWTRMNKCGKYVTISNLSTRIN